MKESSQLAVTPFSIPLTVMFIPDLYTIYSHPYNKKLQCGIACHFNLKNAKQIYKASGKESSIRDKHVHTNVIIVVVKIHSNT